MENGKGLDITCLSDLMKILNRRRYYRGLSDSNYPLIPKLLRHNTLEMLKSTYRLEDPIAIQDKLIERFRRYTPTTHFTINERSKQEDFGHFLCLAQHHGLPTLLLDWTLNPLVALYFAVKELYTCNGVIWEMALKEQAQRKDMTIHLETGEPFDEKRLGPILVVPKPFDARFRAQSSRFSYYAKSIPLNNVEGEMPWNSLIYHIIPFKNKESIKQELQHLQIHEGHLFPDLDGYARYLADGGL
jgi:hypothetical protein